VVVVGACALVDVVVSVVVVVVDVDGGEAGVAAQADTNVAATRATMTTLMLSFQGI
jgi:hypothetical protein